MDRLTAGLIAACLALGGCGPHAPSEEPRGEPAPADTLTPAPDSLPPPAKPAPEPDTVIAPADTVLAEPVPAVEPTPEEVGVRVCAGGDVLLGSNLDTLWTVRAAARLGRYVDPFPSPDSLLAPLRPLFADADLALVNLEGAVGAGPAPSKCRPGSRRCYAFRQPPNIAGALQRLAHPDATVVNLANNHAMDAGAAGFAASVQHLQNAGVYVTGADSLATAVPVRGGRDTVAVLGFSPFRAGPDPRDLEVVRRHIGRAVQRYGQVVVTMHMGAEGAAAQRTPNATETFLGEDRGNPIAFAHAAVDAGAALVIGHGPHVLRAAEWYRDAFILYSLGNLLTYGPFNFQPPRDRAVVACATLGGPGVVAHVTLRATHQTPPGHVHPDPSGRGTWLVDSLSHLDFPDSGLRLDSNGEFTPRRPGR